MKKRKIFIMMALAIMLLTTGCKEDGPTTIHDTEYDENVGSYYLFETYRANQYLTFLDEFDEEKYEIVDISTSIKYSTDGSDSFYMVTYKKKSENN